MSMHPPRKEIQLNGYDEFSKFVPSLVFRQDDVCKDCIHFSLKTQHGALTVLIETKEAEEMHCWLTEWIDWCQENKANV